MNHIYIVQINTANGDTVWQQAIHQLNYYVYPLQLEILNNSLYLVSYHLVKLNLGTGSIVAEDNLQYNPIDCIFDTATNSIYAMHHSGAKRAQMTSRYDTNFIPNKK